MKNILMITSAALALAFVAPAAAEAQMGMGSGMRSSMGHGMSSGMHTSTPMNSSMGMGHGMSSGMGSSMGPAPQFQQCSEVMVHSGGNNRATRCPCTTVRFAATADSPDQDVQWRISGPSTPCKGSACGSATAATRANRASSCSRSGRHMSGS